MFAANRVKKIAETTNLIDITWTYCPSDLNQADLGSRGNWFSGPDWLLHERQWPR